MFSVCPPQSFQVQAAGSPISAFIRAEAELMKFSHGGFKRELVLYCGMALLCSLVLLMIVQRVLMLWRWVTGSCISRSTPFTPPPWRLSGRVWLVLFFNLNLNSPSDSAARQNKLFKSFNEEVQSTDTGVQTHLEQRCLTSYRRSDRCACFCVFLGGWSEFVTWFTLRRRLLGVFQDIKWYWYFGSVAVQQTGPHHSSLALL